MRTRLRGTSVSALAKAGCLCIALLLCPSALSNPNKTVSRVVCRDELPIARREQLSRRLRTITGWPELGFNDSGALQIGNSPSIGGSHSARDLIEKSLSGSSALILEDASNRQDVVFSRVIPGRWKNGNAGRPPAYVVLIDFADFDHLIGDKAALKSFDVGWGFLHEVDHVVSDSTDSDVAGKTGECEEHINIMRQECNLPLRADYFYKLFPQTEDSAFRTRFVRLAFDQKDAVSGKLRRYWVIWDARIVGGLDTREQLADLRR